MLATGTIVDEIQDLKKSRKAILLAHHYQEAEIQEIADAIGDSLELSRKAKDFEGEVILFAGVVFMAETAKILNPTRTVLVPDLDAGCSLVDSCPVEQLRAFKAKNPDYLVVSYINTSAAVKAESDIICTSRNAVKIVNSLPADRPVLFCPDVNLGNFVKKESGRQNMKIWQGACMVHATFPARRLIKLKAEFPNAVVVSHPECPPEVLRESGYIGSTSAIIEYCRDSDAEEFIIMTESGVRFSLERDSPGKKFYFVPNEQCNCSECPYMKRNSLEKVRDALRDMKPVVDLDPAIIAKAQIPMERMLAVK
jgi:quinolinate synthase